jgi:hypothetical protein
MYDWLNITLELRKEAVAARKRIRTMIEEHGTKSATLEDEDAEPVTSSDDEDGPEEVAEPELSPTNSKRESPKHSAHPAQTKRSESPKRSNSPPKQNR